MSAGFVDPVGQTRCALYRRLLPIRGWDHGTNLGGISSRIGVENRRDRHAVVTRRCRTRSRHSISSDCISTPCDAGRVKPPPAGSATPSLTCALWKHEPVNASERCSCRDPVAHTDSFFRACVCSSVREIFAASCRQPCAQIKRLRAVTPCFSTLVCGAVRDRISSCTCRSSERRTWHRGQP